ncbi:MAG: hypothetical protein ACM3ZV_09140 [Bacillota bacterium]
MTARFVLIAAASLFSASAIAADAPTAPVHPAVQPQSAPVVLASADQVRAPSADQQAPAQPKRRIARVTTCRCGDPQSSDAEAQPER